MSVGNKKPRLFTKILFAFLLASVGLISCSVYKFNDASVPPEVKTIRIQFIENKAPYVNPQLSPALTERVRQKIINQTRLSQTNGNADWELAGFVQDYSVSTTGISDKQASLNRLTVTVNLSLTKAGKPEPENIVITRNFDFPANVSLQTAQVGLLDEMVRYLSDDIFNRIFSNW